MSRDGSGNFNLIAGNPVTTGTTIASTWANGTLSDIATALTNSIAKNGETIPTGNLPMGGYKHTGVANASARTDYAAYGQVQDSGSQYLTGVAGADTIAASVTGLAAYATGQTFRFVSAGANTGAVTLNINTIGNKAVTKTGTTALAAGDIPSGAVVEVIYDGTQFQLMGLAPVGSPTFTGTTTVSTINASVAATAPTRTVLDSTTNVATTAFVQTAQGSKIFTIDATVAANALTITLNPCVLDFRSATLTSGAVSTRAVSVAITLTVPSSATLGTVSAQLSRLMVLAIDNAGTVELAVVNISGGVSLAETGVINTTTISAGSTSATTIYSTTGRTGVAYRVVGFIESTQATAGTWATAPSTIQGAGGVALSMLGSIGFGQTWQDVTASRAVNTTYYNLTDRPILVSVTATGNGYLVVGGVNASGAFNTQNNNIVAIVPPGKSYRLAAGFSVTTWSELR